jgi:hypothetical protein
MTKKLEEPLKWVETAPKRLVCAYEDKDRVISGRQLLGRLLSEPTMKSVWKELAINVGERDHLWIPIFSDILCAKALSNKKRPTHRTRRDMRDKYEAMATKITQISTELDTLKLNVPAYDLFPQDVLETLGVPDLHNLYGLKRGAEADKVMTCWPTTVELLNGLVRCAKMRADQSMIEKRPDERSTGNVAARVFVMSLGEDFKYRFGDYLIGTIAAITSVALETDGGFDKVFVQGVLKNKAKVASTIAR